MPRARRRLTGASVAGPFSYDYARPYAFRRLHDPPVLSKRARQRLAWIEYHHAHGHNASLTCRHFGIARSTLHRWLSRYDSSDLTSLEEVSRAPHTRRTPTTPTSTIDLVLAIRDGHPAWSKYKIAVVAQRDFSVVVSASTAGRILSRYGRIEARASLRRKRAARARFRRKRRPKGLVAAAPGQLVQIDTKHLNLPWGEKRFHFEAIDLATRMKVSGVAGNASSASTQRFLAFALSRFPFQTCAVQTDNGSEFAHLFERACEAAGVAHYFSHPRCPKQNAWVERVIRTAIDEFYLFNEIPVTIAEHNAALAAFDLDYNEVRPHQSLGYLTPSEYHRKLTRPHPGEKTP